MTALIVAAMFAASPKLAIPSFTGAKADVASFCAERMADELGRSGFAVVTEKQIGALLGLERQRQLLGCSNESSECLAELTNALGADALVSGSIAKLGARLQLDVRVFSAKTGERLAVVHGEAETEEQIPSALAKLTEELTPLLRSALGVVEAPRAFKPRLAVWLPLGLGVVSGIVGGVSLGVATSAHQSLVGTGKLERPYTYAEGQQLAQDEGIFYTVGWALVSVALVALAVGVLLWIAGGGP